MSVQPQQETMMEKKAHVAPYPAIHFQMIGRAVWMGTKL